MIGYARICDRGTGVEGVDLFLRSQIIVEGERGEKERDAIQVQDWR